MAKKIAILFGGRSVEHEISLRSATNVSRFLPKKYEQILIGISKKGDWFLCNEVGGNVEDGKRLSIHLSVSDPVFSIADSGHPIKPDVIFPILHGTDGEDGSIQGIFASVDLPVVGSGVTGSAICMDKIVSKKILGQSDIPVAPFLTLRAGADLLDYPVVAEQLGTTFMVKSANQGSSVGVSKVTNEEQYDKALADSFKYSEEIIIESYVDGIEVECGVIGNSSLQSTWPGEIALNSAYGFYSYQAKYQDREAIEMVIPARIPQEMQEEVRRLSEKAFRVLKCEDYARVDLFVSTSGQVLVNEINTIPGFTSASMFPVMWENMGLPYSDLLDRLIGLSTKRWESHQKLERNYEDV